MRQTEVPQKYLSHDLGPHRWICEYPQLIPAVNVDVPGDVSDVNAAIWAIWGRWHCVGVAVVWHGCQQLSGCAS